MRVVSQSNKTVLQLSTLWVCPTVKGTEAITLDVRARGGASELLAKDAGVIGRVQHPLLS